MSIINGGLGQPFQYRTESGFIIRSKIEATLIPTINIVRRMQLVINTTIMDILDPTYQS